MNCLKTGRWILSVILILILIPLIIVALPTSAVLRSVTSRENVKEWLEESDVYDETLDTTVDLIDFEVDSMVPDEDQTEEEADKENFLTEVSEALQEEDSDMRVLAEDMFSPGFLQESTETVIDSFYDWFEGEISTPEFEIELAKRDDDLIDFLTIGFEEKFKALPDCPSDFAVDSEFNPLETDCQPTGYDIDEIGNYIEDVEDTEEFEDLKENVKISSNDLDIDDETTEAVQRTFRRMKRIPIFVIGGLTLLTLILLLLVPGAKTKFLVTGATIVLPTIIINLARVTASLSMENIIERVIDEIPEDQAGILRTLVSSIISSLYQGLLWKIGLFTQVVLVIGIVLILLGLVIPRKKKQPSKEETDEEDEDSSDDE